MKINKIVNISIIIVVGALLTSMIIYVSPFSIVRQSPVEVSKTEENMDEHSENEIKEVILSEAELKEFEIEIDSVRSGNLKVHVDINGEIVLNPEQFAHIIPRYPGIVHEIRKHIGDDVKKGEVLAVIESNESLVNYELTSLIDGKVLEMHLTIGEVFQDESHAFLVANLENVWVHLSVYQKDLPYIKLGQIVSLSAGTGIPVKNGIISYISPIVDESTRTVTARVILSNSEGNWKPGLFVSGQVTTNSLFVPIMIPKTAIENINNEPTVFIRTKNGFIPSKVTIGQSNKTHLEIIGGLTKGQEYVSKGGFTLKAEMSKSAFKDEH